MTSCNYRSHTQTARDKSTLEGLSNLSNKRLPAPNHLGPRCRSTLPLSLNMPVEQDLRKSLAKTNVERQQRLADFQESRSPLHDPRFWEGYREAVRNGTYKKPKGRCYIIISPDTLVSTPEKLQEMAKMESPPRVIDTTYTSLNGGNPRPPLMRSDGTPQEVRVGQVHWKEFREIKSKSDCDLSLFVWVDKEIRGAWVVKGSKKVQAEQEEEEEEPLDTWAATETTNI